jgi:hypothetical protein
MATVPQEKLSMEFVRQLLHFNRRETAVQRTMYLIHWNILTAVTRVYEKKNPTRTYDNYFIWLNCHKI